MHYSPPAQTRDPQRGRFFRGARPLIFALSSALLAPAAASSPVLALRLATQLSPPPPPAPAPLHARDAVGVPLRLSRELPPRPAAALPPVSSAPSADPAYRDQLIGGPGAAEDPGEAPAAELDLTPGVRSWVVDGRIDHRRAGAGGNRNAYGTALLHRRETESYGDLSLDVQLGHLDGPPAGARDSGRVAKVTLTQDRFAVTDTLLMSTQLGVTRTNIAPWLASSLRFALPTSLIAGAATVLETPNVRVNAAAGSVGRVVGLNVQGFERVPGETASLGLSVSSLPGWLLGANAVALRGSDQVPDNAALTIGAEYRSPQQGPFRAQALVDDGGHAAGWLDGQWRSGRSLHRFGAYRVDPGTRYGEGHLNDDTRGAYYRGEFRRGFDFAAYGAEVIQSNLRRDPDRAGETGASAFANASLHIDRDLTLGGGFFARSGRARLEGRAGGGAAVVNAFASRQSPLGFSRLDGSYGITRRDDAPGDERVASATWAQTWPRWRDAQASTLLSHQDERLAAGHVRRTIASVGANGQAGERLRWDLSLTAARVDDGTAVERNYNAAASLDWQLAPAWTLQLQWYRTRIQTASDALAETACTRDDQVQLIVRYSELFGVPYPRVAGWGGRSGTGRVLGSIYLDENGDGLRQPFERGVPGVVVILDGRQTQVSDREGRFTFPLVPTGRRSITVTLDRVPLPWGLADESPRAVEVPVRGDSRIDIGLDRVGG